MFRIHDFRCPSCGHEFEAMIKLSETEASCPKCNVSSAKVFLTPPKLDWGGIGASPSASPEFVNRFERVHKEQAKREEKSMKEHGDYGSSPGAD